MWIGIWCNSISILMYKLYVGQYIKFSGMQDWFYIFYALRAYLCIYRKSIEIRIEYFCSRTCSRYWITFFGINQRNWVFIYWYDWAINIILRSFKLYRTYAYSNWSWYVAWKVFVVFCVLSNDLNTKDKIVVALEWPWTLHHMNLVYNVLVLFIQQEWI